ncbi:zinc finger protein 395-like [Brachionichthys hirsutus]|uniref:zinc finger protein 395-like n=1 Tax=Brachionichthys hirsutus TaxID=412623 RepID=UPI0036047442
MLPKTRLGKRSPLGALVGKETDCAGIAMATTARQQTASRVKGHAALKVYFQTGGAADAPGAVEPPHPPMRDASARPSSHPSSSSCSRSVSSCIDVPRRTSPLNLMKRLRPAPPCGRRSPQEVDVDELMAAMVLSSLSCSPPLLDTAAPPMDWGGGELSDGSSSGYWSIGHGSGSPAPSPPITDPAAVAATPTDEGLDMELEEELFDEPAARKRRNSMKAAFRCLWPGCGKVLTSVVGIKRHIRTTHLSHGGGGSDQERCSRSEEDFYYTEINQWDEQQAPPLCAGPASPTSSSPPSPPPPPSPSPPVCATLSCSAPPSSGRSWQVQSEHSYQAPPPSHVTAAPSCHWMAPPTTCLKQGLAFRVRSVSVGEQWLHQHSAPCRRIRGEAKKCRKVYGIERRDQWCTSCRWKKACQRFLD